MAARWAHGDVVVRREVLGFDPIERQGPLPPWTGEPLLTVPVFVVEDTDEQLVTYIPPGAPFAFPEGEWPTGDGGHPWRGKDRWQGHGCLMVQRPGDHHAVWHFWQQPGRRFSCWYINIQTAFRRTADGYDTQDLELDIVVSPDRSWRFKDLEVLPDRVAQGRYAAPLTEWVVELGEQLGAELDAGRWWWDPTWAEWEPDPSWVLGP
ncbi:MAG: DUF402 domain-containing protein [Acidimicrobiales bacterium]